MKTTLKAITALLTATLILSGCLAQPAPSAQPETISPTRPFTRSDLDIPGWNRLLPYDAIRPVYQPRFISAEEAGEFLQGTELVMGVAWEGEAKAYPVTVLGRREMVNDEMAGVPYLVSW